ncbi:hypothetical protein OnM2_050004 [Erysiphe neolycopersici]|uniref:Uncharacterized protein n=1 Tax=Erysiphe neolycopersici TaxID=212602 RepID=A0A420HSP6_9PEZI|nr:hypothetical protein OnM2_050004 [Erysiphe neolycopersici]
MNIHILLLLTKLIGVFANTEKVIFVGPERNSVLISEYYNIWNLCLQTLSPRHETLRTQVLAEFPSLISKYGRDSWFLLDGISKGQRFEVRICWTATQPTSFHLVTHEISKVHKSLNLKSSLEQYSRSRKLDANDSYEMKVKNHHDLKNTELIESSVLLLQISATADYYTSKTSLMQNPLPVYVDIILDPYFLNIIPMSLLTTTAYILMLAIGGWYFATFLIYWAHSFLLMDINLQKKSL